MKPKETKSYETKKVNKVVIKERYICRYFNRCMYIDIKILCNYLL